MDSFFSLKGKEACFISGIFGLFIYFLLLGGTEDQNKYYYIILGFVAWSIMKTVYWSWRTSQLFNISKYDQLRCYEEIEKIKLLDEQRGNAIEYKIFGNS